MLFNSIEFGIFLPVVFALFWLIPGRLSKLRNLVLLLASYVFYGWWDWRFLILILASSLIDYSVGMLLQRAEPVFRRKLLLAVSIFANLGLLGFFKYYNFFIDSFVQTFTFFGAQISPHNLDIILPVGISFYTFQTMSYTIDVYRRTIKPCKDPISFFAYVSFFPQLVAGPIERASNLLPQFSKPKEFNYDHATDGLRQILWGLFKKVVIADNCAPIVNAIFADPSSQSASTLLLGAILFAFQIYGDFSGYSDMAIGIAKLFGFNLRQNFAFPYFSRDIAEFWRRWHISLSTWFRDYLYIPLGGSRVSKLMSIRNTLIVFVVSGFWHGANWTFIIWGLLHAIYFLPLLIRGANRANLAPIERNIPSVITLLKMGYTFTLVCIGWVFFRAQSVGDALLYLKHMLSVSIFSIPDLLPGLLLVQIALLLIVEWKNRSEAHGLVLSRARVSCWARWGIYLILCLSIVFFGSASNTFIYFQF